MHPSAGTGSIVELTVVDGNSGEGSRLECSKDNRLRYDDVEDGLQVRVSLGCYRVSCGIRSLCITPEKVI